MPKWMNIPKCSERHSSKAFCVISSYCGDVISVAFLHDAVASLFSLEELHDVIKTVAASNKLIRCFIMKKIIDFFFCKSKEIFLFFMNVDMKIFIPLPSKCGCSSVGRAKASQALGRGFEPRHPLKTLIC